MNVKERTGCEIDEQFVILFNSREFVILSGIFTTGKLPVKIAKYMHK